jgi:hypothetical protein
MIERQTGGVVTPANFGPKENGVRPEMICEMTRMWPERVVRGFCRLPRFREPEGGEKSSDGNPAGSTQYFAPGTFAGGRGIRFAVSP